MWRIIGFAVLLLLPNPQQARAEAEHHAAGGNVPRLGYHVAPRQEPPVAKTVDFHVARDDYDGFLGKLGDVLKNNPARGNKEILKVPVLPPLRRPEEKPARWIHVRLFGEEAAENTTIAIRDDNIYLVGFHSGKTNRWYVFKNNQHLMPKATPLSVGDRYRDLVGAGGYKNLPKQTLGKQAALEAVRLLANHGTAATTATDAELGASLARLCVMIAEAERFKGIRGTVKQGWSKGTGTRITVEQAERVVLWCKISRALLNFDRTGTWTKNRVLEAHGITNQTVAAGILSFLLFPSGTSPCNDDDATWY